MLMSTLRVVPSNPPRPTARTRVHPWSGLRGVESRAKRRDGLRSRWAPRRVCDRGDLIGRGGMGEVYRGRDTALDRNVAIKVLPEAFASDPDRFARFKREAKVLASLNHAHIAHVYGIEDRDGVHALVMELVEGETLAEHIARGPSPRRSASIAKQIAEALEASHERGIIHRDLKPANIKVRPDGTVKVLDFGLAKALDSPGDSTEASSDVLNSPTMTSPAATMRGVILGTAAYMSPEQAKGKPVDRRCDIWAFGCVLYEMLTGRRAFAADDVTDTIAAILTKEPDWNALPRNTPTHVRWLLRRCLERDLGRRLPHIGVARLEIDEGPTALPSNTRQRWWIAAAVLGLVLLATVAAIMILWRPVAVQPETRHLAILLPDEAGFSRPGSAPSQAISPDGRQIVFACTGADGSRLWLRSLDAPAPRPLVGTDDGFGPFWSPDGVAHRLCAARSHHLRPRRCISGPGIRFSAVDAHWRSGTHCWRRRCRWR
jgi:eukaryotic-like serine/threonine-protein kinase